MYEPKLKLKPQTTTRKPTSHFLHPRDARLVSRPQAAEHRMWSWRKNIGALLADPLGYRLCGDDINKRKQLEITSIQVAQTKIKLANSIG